MICICICIYLHVYKLNIIYAYIFYPFNYPAHVHKPSYRCIQMHTASLSTNLASTYKTWGIHKNRRVHLQNWVFFLGHWASRCFTHPPHRNFFVEPGQLGALAQNSLRNSQNSVNGDPQHWMISRNKKLRLTSNSRTASALAKFV